MKSKRLTIKELAETTDISEPTLKKLRTKDNSNPTLDILLKIASALDVSISNLIGGEEQIPLMYQERMLTVPEDITEFVVIFTRKIFTFSEGTKAVFKKYKHGDPVTKYVLNKDGVLFEKASSELCIFRDEKFQQFSVDQNFIMACIVKELYEVNYV